MSDGRGRDVTRRAALELFAAIPLALALDSSSSVAQAARAAARVLEDAATSGTPYVPRFFTAHEWRILRRLVDYIIPRDERSGSATDAGVPEFIDFMMLDRPEAQLPMRGGLNWLDTQCRERFDASFADCTHDQCTVLLDDIAWPALARPELSQGVAFFTKVRDLTASGFWTSKMGMADLRYMGNGFVHEWRGCPETALAKLGVSY